MCIKIIVIMLHNFHISLIIINFLFSFNTCLLLYCGNILQFHLLFFRYNISIVLSKFIFDAKTLIFSILIIGCLVSWLYIYYISFPCTISSIIESSKVGFVLI